MSQARIAAVAMLAGAVGMLVVSGASVQVFVLVGESIERLPERGNITLQMLFGGVCAAVLAVGMIGAAYYLIQPTSIARLALVCGAAAFVIALLCIAWGNTRVAMAFSKLAQAESVSPEPFTRDCQSGLLPMRIGYALVLAASGNVMVAIFITPPCKDGRRSTLGTVALIVSGLASLLLVAGYAFAVLHSWRFHGSLTAQPVDPGRLAESLSGIVLSVYLISLTLAGLALACVLLALSQGRHVAEDVALTAMGD